MRHVFGRLFGGVEAMMDAVRGYGTKVAGRAGLPSFAERYWSAARH